MALNGLLSFFSFFDYFFYSLLKIQFYSELGYTPEFQTKQSGVLNLTFICAKFKIL